MESTKNARIASIVADLTAGMIVFLVAVPLCLGVAMTCGTPLISGLLAGIVGGILVGSLSGSHTSISGASPAMCGIVIGQIALLGSFEAFLMAMVIAGLIQIVLGVARLGFVSAFFPSSVVRGFLAAVGTIMILKQIPHVLGHDTDPQGNMAFHQPDHETTFSAFIELFGGIHIPSAIIGIASLALLMNWDRITLLKRTKVPAPLAVIVFGVVTAQLFRSLGGTWDVTGDHLVQVPFADGLSISQFLRMPDFSQWNNPAIYHSGLLIGLVVSLETLFNIEAIDRSDPEHRHTPSSRELLSQGIGNLVLGLIGGIPISSVIVRSKVNIDSGAKTKLSAIAHGILMLICVLFFPKYLNLIPLSCLAAILLVAGMKLARPQTMRLMWEEGRYQFIPFATTLSMIVLTDLVTGLLIGMAVSFGFILNSNMRRPLRRIKEKHLGGAVLRIELGNQVSFLNRGALETMLQDLPRGSHLLLDGESTDFIDPDVLALIGEFKDRIAPSRNIHVSLLGFRKKYDLDDEILFVDHSTRELQEKLTSQQVLQVLKEGNQRFLRGQRLTRNFNRSLSATSEGQSPIAVVLSCIDSRTPAELVFDLGIGDIFSVRLAGHVINAEVLGSLEYSCKVVGSKLILVMGHTRCGAVTAAVDLACSSQNALDATGCQNLDPIIVDIQNSIDSPMLPVLREASPIEKKTIIELVAIRNVERCVAKILRDSGTISRLVDEGRVAVVGAIFDVTTGKINFLSDNASFEDVGKSTV